MKLLPCTTRKCATVDTSPSSRFILEKQSFQPQYAQLYFCRLSVLRTRAMVSARRKWGESSSSLCYADRIADIQSGQEKDTVIIGVIFREMKAKPSILQQYSSVTNQLIPPPPDRARTPYSNSTDKLIIEDENGRCTLDITSVTISTRSFTTGIIMAVRGFEDPATGCFKVNAFATLGPAPQKPLSSLASDNYVALVSGLEFGSNGQSNLAVELLMEFLRGNIGDDPDASFSASIVYMIVAGNVLASTELRANISQTSGAKQSGEDRKHPMTSSALIELDRFLTGVAAVLPVAVMPGENDPVNHMLPQQPIHRCLLPCASRSKNLARVTNPFSCSIDSRVVSGTSGQPVNDFALYGNSADIKGGNEKDNGNAVNSSKDALINTGLDVLETLVDSQHLAPTCPDTLASYPFYKEDPFIMESTPHILFAGNQRNFSTRLYKRSSVKKDAMKTDTVSREGDVTCRLVCVPKFRDTGRLVLVNLRTLDCAVREFALGF